MRSNEWHFSETLNSTQLLLLRVWWVGVKYNRIYFFSSHPVSELSCELSESAGKLHNKAIALRNTMTCSALQDTCSECNKMQSSPEILFEWEIQKKECFLDFRMGDRRKLLSLTLAFQLVSSMREVVVNILLLNVLTKCVTFMGEPQNLKLNPKLKPKT